MQFKLLRRLKRRFVGRVAYGSIEEAELNPQKVRLLYVYKADLRQYEGRLVQFERLESLNLSWCLNTELPEEILKLKNLEGLSVLNTPLKKFPVWLAGLPNLESLSIRGTDIRKIPTDIKLFSRLRQIDFGGNNLFSVPPEIGELRELRSLYLPDNPLSALPDEVLELPKLRGLGLAGTNFSQAEVDKIRVRFPHATVWSRSELAEIHSPQN